MVFILFVSFLILLRFGELLLSKRNERWLLQHGAKEYGKGHYPLIVLLHILFIVSLIIEYDYRQTKTYSLVFLVIYLLLLMFKAWVILSLGKFWNTKIYRTKDFPLVKKGPYKYFKHPNYAVVTAEIAVIPLAFYLYDTAVIFSILNLSMLGVRIREENKVLEH